MWRQESPVLNRREDVDAVADPGAELVQITGLSNAAFQLRREEPASVVGQGAWRRKIQVPFRTESQELEVTLCEAFSHLLSYPGQDYKSWLELCLAEFDDTSIRETLGAFVEVVRTEPLTTLEERFVATFEMTTKRPLEIGWHLYGEQYKRGEFLVKMRNMLREHQVEESQELPDHLSHCLKLLPKMEDDDACAFLAHYLLPALERLLRGFQDEND